MKNLNKKDIKKIENLIEYYLEYLTEWEENFLDDIYMHLLSGKNLTPGQKEKLRQIDAKTKGRYY